MKLNWALKKVSFMYDEIGEGFNTYVIRWWAKPLVKWICRKGN